MRRTHVWAVSVIALWASASVGTPGEVETSPTGAVAGTAERATTEPAALLRDADLSVFFPPTPREGNAAEAYIQAFYLLKADRDRTRYGDQWEALLARPLLAKAVDYVSTGAACRACDFIPFLPDDLSRTTKFPYLAETQLLAKLLAVRFDQQMADKRREAALASARTLMALGRHLRLSALVLGQEVQGIAVERLAIRCFRRSLTDADEITSAKLRVVEHLLDDSQQFIVDQVTSHTAKGAPAFSSDLVWLGSAHPVLRCEAILNMAQAALPEDVLVKPQPEIDVGALMQKIAEATTPTQLRLEREQVEVKVKWPRRGARSGVTAEDVQRIRRVVGPLAQDPDPRVGVLAKRLLDALVEPKPPPPPPQRTPRAGPDSRDAPLVPPPPAPQPPASR